MELFVMLTMDGRKCALRALDVRSIMEIEAITYVPRTPNHVLGLSTKRSQTLTVIDCMRAAGLQGQSEPLGKRAAVVDHGGHSYALLVDSIEDVEDSNGQVKQIGGGYGRNWTKLADGMIEANSGPALLLNVAALVAGPDELPDAA